MGYGVVGLGFASGDVLALRRCTASSIGPPFTTVWHRDATERWTFYVGAEPRRTCPRYFGAALARVVVTELRLRWTGPDELTVSAPATRLEWAVRLRRTPGAELGGLLWRAVPAGLWRSERFVRVASAAADRLLDVGRLRAEGSTPNGQRFRLRPERLWVVEGSAAVVGGRELGPLAGSAPAIALGDFPVPLRGLFATGSARFEPFDPLRHDAAAAAGRVERAGAAA